VSSIQRASDSRATPDTPSRTVLVVEDDVGLRAYLTAILEEQGYSVIAAGSGEEALQALGGQKAMLAVLDIGLPGMDGLELCRRVRRLGNRVPILMLTGRDAVSDRIDGLDVGADDYMVKPFDVGELKARLRALLRRASPERAAAELSFAEVRLDPARHCAQVAGRFVELTRTEYQLLELLMLNPGSVLPHSLIYERVWGYDFGPASNALRVYVGYLRRKLEQAGARELIHTVRGVGYVLREP
jgi:two-component system response regulator MprA